MILQNILLGYGEMYLRFGNGQASDTMRGMFSVNGQRDRIRLSRGCKVRTDTYMNAFDVGVWKKYTIVSGIMLKIFLRGRGEFRLLWERQGEEVRCLEYHDIGWGSGWQEYCFGISDRLSEGILYFEFTAEEDSELEASFEADIAAGQDVRISMVICTYHRQKQLEALAAVLRQGMADWLRVQIVDNASEITGWYGDGIRIYHNSNTGGSGGFARGMKETVERLERFPATHVVLMDDDALLHMESVYRLRAVLVLIREEYRDEVVAGRMFRADKPQIQYTAAEIWNGGDIRHIGWNQDMSDRGCLWDMNENQGAEYGGWWFACFPIGFVKENRPLPFFLHCDDVEYGLRHGGTPIVLNGIQVWHETYDHRNEPVMLYYDTRNTMIVNAMRRLKINVKIPMELWKNRISRHHVQGDYLAEYMMIKALLDFMRGPEWFFRADAGALHDKLRREKNTCLLRMRNAVLWRLAEKRAEKSLQRVIWDYEKL